MKIILPLFLAAASLTLADPAPAEATEELKRLLTARRQAELEDEFIPAFPEHDPLPEGFRAEALALLDHYQKTGDARYATREHHMTMLHLAAMYCQLELVEELLAAGADPNALMSYGFEPDPDTPLSAALQYRTLPAQKCMGDFLRLAQLLQRGGASLNHKETNNLLSLVPSRFDIHVNGDKVSDGEDIALGLMDLGVKPGIYTVESMVEAGYTRAFARALAEMTAQELAELRQYMEILNECAMPYFRPYSDKDERQRMLSMATLFLEGVDFRQQPENAGQEIFDRVTDSLPEWTPEDSLEFVDDFLALLIRHGADTGRPNEYHPQACAADYIAAHEELSRKLADKHGIRIEPPAHTFREDVLMQQLEDIPPAVIRPEETKAAWEMLVRLIASPTEVQLGKPKRHLQTVGRAIELLWRADRERAEQALMGMPAWRWSSAWKGGSARTASRHLLHTLLQAKEARLSASFVDLTARRLLEQGRPDVAHAIIGLLEFNKDAAPYLERLAGKDTPPALRAAALSCQLRLKGLPDLAALHEKTRNGEPGADFENSKPPMKLAMQALSSPRFREQGETVVPEELIYTGRGKFQASATTVKALHELGAPLAAAYCQTGKGDAVAASLELEIALAQFILAHEADFRSPYLPCDCGWDSDVRPE